MSDKESKPKFSVKEVFWNARSFVVLLIAAALFAIFSAFFVICSWFGWHLLPETWTATTSVTNVVGWIVVVWVGLATLIAIVTALCFPGASDYRSFRSGGGYPRPNSSISPSSDHPIWEPPSYTPPKPYPEPKSQGPTNWTEELRKRTEEQQRWQHHKDQRGW